MGLQIASTISLQDKRLYLTTDAEAGKAACMRAEPCGGSQGNHALGSIVQQAGVMKDKTGIHFAQTPCSCGLPPRWGTGGRWDFEVPPKYTQSPYDSQSRLVVVSAAR